VRFQNNSKIQLITPQKSRSIEKMILQPGKRPRGLLGHLPKRRMNEAAGRRTLRVRRHAELPLTRLVFEWFRSYDWRMEFPGFALASIQNVSLALSRKMALKTHS
jgi:hypothetical protein